MAGKFKKILSVTLILIIIGGKTFIPAAVLAQEVSPTPEPTPTETITETPSPTPTPEPTTIPTPTPTPTDTQAQSQDTTTISPTPTPDIAASNSGQLANNTNSTAITGQNSVTPPATDSAALKDSTASGSAQPSPEPSNAGVTNSSAGGSNSNDNSTSTGTAASVTDIQNLANTNNVNSQVVYQTINLFVDKNGSIDLSAPFTIASAVIPQHANDAVINLSVTDVKNYSYLANDVVSVANTGKNTTTTASGQATINTASAYSVVSLLNQVNFTIVNSVIHVVTINIFGKLNGNIILPDINASTSCNGCGVTMTQNTANVTNNVDSKAVSGQNTITSSNGGTINSGNVGSVVNLLNLVNMNFVGVNVVSLIINPLGYWNGNFLGWGVFPSQAGGAALSLNSSQPNNGGANCPSCQSGTVLATNNADVVNNVSSTANTGKNNINGAQGLIKTGNAYSVVSLANFVNINFINSLGFFGFVNIFGEWDGNIGDKKAFITPTPTPTDTEQSKTKEASEQKEEKSVKEDGGLLSITQTNNVGEYVNPGDTVTFFVEVKNTGSGKVYGTKLHLNLFYNEENMGGADFNLGDIPVTKRVKLTTGLVLSKKAKGGIYTAKAIVEGTTGEDNKPLSAESNSAFRISGITNTLVETAKENTLPKPAVLGTKNITKNSGKKANTLKYILLFASFVSIYLAIRAYKKRLMLARIMAKNTSWKSKLYTLRMFLL